MSGLMEVFEHLSLRWVKQNAIDPARAAQTLSCDSPQFQERASVLMQQFSSFDNKEDIFTKDMVVAEIVAQMKRMTMTKSS